MPTSKLIDWLQQKLHNQEIEILRKKSPRVEIDDNKNEHIRQESDTRKMKSNRHERTQKINVKTLILSKVKNQGTMTTNLLFQKRLQSLNSQRCTRRSLIQPSQLKSQDFSSIDTLY